MSTAAVLFASTFIVVLALGLQSLNVNGGHRWMAAITSIAISASNLVVLKVMPGPTDVLQIAAYMLGGPVGIVAAMALHPWLLARFKREQRPPRRARQWGVANAVTIPPAPPMPPPTRSERSRALCEQLAQDLLHPEALGHQATPEIRQRAARALNP